MAFFAATPPLSCSYMLLVWAATDRTPDRQGKLVRQKRPLCVSWADLERAHFMRTIRPSVDEVGVFEPAMYGTTDAATCWETEAADLELASATPPGAQLWSDGAWR